MTNVHRDNLGRITTFSEQLISSICLLIRRRRMKRRILYHWMLLLICLWWISLEQLPVSSLFVCRLQMYYVVFLSMPENETIS